MADALANGQKLRVLTVVDACTRECVALEAATHLRGQDVAWSGVIRDGVVAAC
jgi:hypothetical protein